MAHALRSDITRATFHALEGDAALVPAIAERIETALGRLDPAEAPALAPEIGAAIHAVAMPAPGAGLSPFRRLVFARRLRRISRFRAEIARRRREIPTRFPRLAWVMLCDPDATVREAALAALPGPPGPFHAALAAHAHTLARGEPG